MTLKRQFDKNLNNEFIFHFHENGDICANNENYNSVFYECKKDIKEKNIETQNILDKQFKRAFYKQIINRLRENYIKQFWIGINVVFYPDMKETYIANIEQHELMVVEMNYFYTINIKLSNNNLKRLKLIDMELYDTLKDCSGENFKNLFPYRC